jgi:hypothetical protein
MKKYFLVSFFIIFSSHFFPQDVKFDSLVQKGIREIYGMKFDQADRTFKDLIADYPRHPAGKFFLAMIDWQKILTDLDNEEHDDLFFEKLEDVIFQCDQLLDEDKNNFDAWFFKGGSIGFRGRLRATRESWIKAADDGRTAMPIVYEAYKIDSTKADIQLGFGIYNYYAAVIPDKYPFVKPVMIFFPKGDKAKGLEQLKYVAMNGKYAKYESRYFLLTLNYQFENNMYEAERWAKELLNDFPDNPIFQRYLGRINVKLGRLDIAQNIFTDIYRKCEAGYTGYTKTSKREAAYYRGLYYRNYKSDLDSARIHFLECEKLSREIDKEKESGFLVNAVLYLGMIADKKNERSKAEAYYKQALDMKEFGSSHKNAKKYLDKPYQ